jgi:peptidoglycan/LPS O-acetylase OafA/YrhL
MTFADHLERIGFKGPGFDRIRLIAALIVVLHHCSFYATANIADDFLSAASSGAINFGRFAVNIFFITSGVLVTPGLLRSGDLVSFTVNRALRVMPALVVVVTATVFIVGPIMSTLPAKQYFCDMETYLYLKNIAFRAVRYLPGVETSDGTAIIVNGALWTIYFEVLSYGALALIFLSGITRRPKALLFVFAATYSLYVYSIAMAVNPLGVPDTLLIFSQLFLYFLAGAILSAFSSLIPYSGRIAAVFVVVFLISFPLGIVSFTLPISMSYIVAYVGYSNLLGSKNLKIDLSYGVYLIHAVVLTVLIVMVPQIDNFVAATLVVVAITTVLSFLSWVYIEEPCLRRKTLVGNAVQRVIPLFLTKRSKPAKPQA